MKNKKNTQPIAWTSANELAGLGLMHGDMWERPKDKDDIPLYLHRPCIRIATDNLHHQLTGDDVMHHRKVSLADRLAVWGSVIGIIVIVVLGIWGGIK